MPPRLRPDLAVMEGYHSPQVDVAVRLNTNESPYPPPAAFVEELASGITRLPLHRYPDRAATELHTAIGASCGVASDQVWAAKGSNEILQTLLLGFGGPGRPALVFTPTYALHTHIAEVTGTPVVRAPRRADFTVTPDDILAAIEEHQPAVVFFCNPNNPTGNAERLDSIEAAAIALPDGLVVVDEAYVELGGDTVAAWIERFDNLVVTRTLSKVWSLAALRIGYALGPPAILTQIEAVHLPYHLDAVAQLAGVIALRYQAEMQSRVQALVSGRERLLAGLRALPGLTVWPSVANFVLFRPDGGDAAELWQGLLDRGVLVRNFAASADTPNCLRVNAGTPDENEAFLAALAAVLGDVALTAPEGSPA